jgi:hypothetical protein
MQDMRWSVKERHSLDSVERLHAGTDPALAVYV